ncbi:hypothetical protein GGF32_006993 [Allomyces javanicus]|nr:hypothetical protein GGF32_006993 [Allomyces javanicus]
METSTGSPSELRDQELHEQPDETVHFGDAPAAFLQVNENDVDDRLDQRPSDPVVPTPPPRPRFAGPPSPRPSSARSVTPTVPVPSPPAPAARSAPLSPPQPNAPLAIAAAANAATRVSFQLAAGATAATPVSAALPARKPHYVARTAALRDALQPALRTTTRSAAEPPSPTTASVPDPAPFRAQQRRRNRTASNDLLDRASAAARASNGSLGASHASLGADGDRDVAIETLLSSDSLAALASTLPRPGPPPSTAGASMSRRSSRSRGPPPAMGRRRSVTASALPSRAAAPPTASIPARRRGMFPDLLDDIDDDNGLVVQGTSGIDAFPSMASLAGGASTRSLRNVRSRTLGSLAAVEAPQPPVPAARVRRRRTSTAPAGPMAEAVVPADMPPIAVGLYGLAGIQPPPVAPDADDSLPPSPSDKLPPVIPRVASPPTHSPPSSPPPRGRRAPSALDSALRRAHTMSATPPAALEYTHAGDMLVDRRTAGTGSKSVARHGKRGRLTSRLADAVLEQLSARMQAQADAASAATAARTPSVPPVRPPLAPPPPISPGAAFAAVGTGTTSVPILAATPPQRSASTPPAEPAALAPAPAIVTSAPPPPPRATTAAPRPPWPPSAGAPAAAAPRLTTADLAQTLLINHRVTSTAPPPMPFPPVRARSASAPAPEPRAPMRGSHRFAVIMAHSTAGAAAMLQILAAPKPKPPGAVAGAIAVRRATVAVAPQVAARGEEGGEGGGGVGARARVRVGGEVGGAGAGGNGRTGENGSGSGEGATGSPKKNGPVKGILKKRVKVETVAVVDAGRESGANGEGANGMAGTASLNASMVGEPEVLAVDPIEALIEDLVERFSPRLLANDHSQRFTFVNDFTRLAKMQEDVTTKNLINNNISTTDVDTRRIENIGDDELMGMIWNLYFYMQAMGHDFLLPFPTRQAIKRLVDSLEPLETRNTGLRALMADLPREPYLNYKAVLGHCHRIVLTATVDVVPFTMFYMFGTLLFSTLNSGDLKPSKPKSFLDAIRRGTYKSMSTLDDDENDPEPSMPKSDSQTSLSSQLALHTLDPADASKDSIFSAALDADDLRAHMNEVGVLRERTAMVVRAVARGTEAARAGMPVEAVIMEHLVGQFEHLF